MHSTLWLLRQRWGDVIIERNEGVGEQRVAELRAMYLNGTLGAYCDRVWQNREEFAA